MRRSFNICDPSVKRELNTQLECVTVPSVMAARWVGRNSGPNFRCLWTKVHLIKYACAGEIAVSFQRRFPFWRSLFSFQRHSPSSCEIGYFLRFWAAKLFAGGVPNVWQNFINLGRHQTCCKAWWPSTERNYDPAKKRKENEILATYWPARPA